MMTWLGWALQHFCGEAAAGLLHGAPQHTTRHDTTEHNTTEHNGGTLHNNTAPTKH